MSKEESQQVSLEAEKHSGLPVDLGFPSEYTAAQNLLQQFNLLDEYTAIVKQLTENAPKEEKKKSSTKLRKSFKAYLSHLPGDPPSAKYLGAGRGELSRLVAPGGAPDPVPIHRFDPAVLMAAFTLQEGGLEDFLAKLGSEEKEKKKKKKKKKHKDKDKDKDKKKKKKRKHGDKEGAGVVEGAGAANAGEQDKKKDKKRKHREKEGEGSSEKKKHKKHKDKHKDKEPSSQEKPRT
mmetsp:Transcript_26808/g.43772  ORF Transcript_26808/g.43772 Transcript_26808/m.43772 type:complete len:235 (-) Transcript_26808:314-1018(-)|eukprot:CAMPEP_0184334994 /NCGR_PEP_ID=MMETSP1089-20130417/3637_1 /TAXON_ID=38269 ORGANISM="Gloeochaete wittrockiana, Strain SAG46.84" /NCGR_SAMPLE_ID=MMETSP1089 /ASSEMBLY_ACC=CAM_ASM_000445 /LENGTH=234 /DNA_ID=CAMNT_0026659457 /DNA_START=60 /DNA_END=764 /DNA_ORIENTATION=+